MNTLNTVFVLGTMASIGLTIAGVIGLEQNVTSALGSWLRIIIGVTALIVMAVTVGAKALHRKQANFECHDND